MHSYYNYLIVNNNNNNNNNNIIIIYFVKGLKSLKLKFKMSFLDLFNV